jgi:hypothetical protein
VAHGQGATVVLGAGGVAVVSTDLENWTRINTFIGSADPYDKISVAFGNGRFVVMGSRRIWTSPNGLNWTERQGPELPSFHENLVFSNGRFAMNVTSSEADGVFTSTDGVTWTRATSETYWLQRRSDGFWGIKDGIWKSADAVNWEKVLDGNGKYPRCAAELNGTLIVGGLYGELLVSQNEQTWEDLMPPIDPTVRRLAYGNGDFLRFGEKGISTSKDGAVWETVANAPGLKNAAYGNGVWVGATMGREIATSTDGRTWTVKPGPIPVMRIFFADGVFIGQASDGWIVDDLPSLAVSKDGASWRKVDFEGTTWVRVFGNVNGRWAAAIAGPRPVTSEDGENWTVHPADANLAAYPLVAAGNGRFLSWGNSGMGPGRAFWSFDGIKWDTEQATSGTTHVVASLTFGGGLFVLTDVYGNVYNSTDGRNWKGTREDEHMFFSAAYGNGKWLIASGDSILRSLPPVQHTPVIQLQSDSAMYYLRVSSGVGEMLEVQSAPTATGPWTVLSRYNFFENSSVTIPLSLTNSARFFRGFTP